MVVLDPASGSAAAGFRTGCCQLEAPRSVLAGCGTAATVAEFQRMSRGKADRLLA